MPISISMKAKNFATLVFIFSLTLQIYAQNIPVYNWRVHLPYFDAISVEMTDDRVYCATTAGFFYVEKDDRSITRLSRTDGLSDINISALGYSKDKKVLVVGYKSGNIDVIKNNRIINVNSILTKNLTGSKTINEILINGNFAILSTDFAISVLDLDKFEIKNTYFIGNKSTSLKVYSTSLFQDTYFAITEQGIFKANINSPNLSDYRSWLKDTTISFIPRHSATFNNRILVSKGDSIYQFKDNNWSQYGIFDGFEIRSLKVYNKYLNISNYFKTIVYDSSNTMNFQSSPIAKMGNVKMGVYDGNDLIYMADGSAGLFVYSKQYSQATALSPNGPSTNEAFYITNFQNNIWVAGGGYNKSYVNTFSRAGFYFFDNKDWTNYNDLNNTDLTLFDRDFCIIKQQASSKKTYACTWTRGLFVLENGQITKHFDTNKEPSSLGVQPNSNSGVNDFVRVGGVDFDSKNNVWFSNYGSAAPISVLKTDNTWQNFTLTGGINRITSLLIDDFDQKWIIVPNTGIAVMNKENTNSVLLSENGSSGNLHDLNINCMVKDMDGVIWVGTNKGPTAFYSPGGVFNNVAVAAQRVKIDKNEFDEFVDYLLEDQSINCMAIDGANRKWFGTNNGVWLMSADGTQQIFHFTIDNSPLLSNSIFSISITDLGEVFFGTDKGIISFRSDASKGTETNSNVVVFPNPVKQNYSGPITISGVSNNAYIKITDISGSLVYQTRANGGTAVWNGLNYSGLRPRTGVYLIHASNEFGQQKLVSKVMIVN